MCIRLLITTDMARAMDAAGRPQGRARIFRFNRQILTTPLVRAMPILPSPSPSSCADKTWRLTLDCCCVGHGSPDPRYIYTPYGVESRPQPQLPLPLPYDNRNDMPSLPWPNPTAAAAAASRRYPEPIPSISLNPSHEPWADRSIGHYPPSHASDSEYRCSSARCRFTASSQEHLTCVDLPPSLNWKNQCI